MNTNTFGRFVLVSSLFLASPLMLYALLGFVSADWTMPLLGAGMAGGLGFLYWWPLGAFLAAYRGRTLQKVVYGYLLSLPLYFTTLTVLYRLFGATFRPFENGHLLVYMSATPQFYLMVRLLFYLTGRFTRGTVVAASIVFAAGTAAPFVLMTTGNLTWPQRQDQAAIVNTRIVDTAAGSIIEKQTV